MNVNRPATGMAVALALVIALAAVPGAAGQASAPQERVIVELESDGDAALTTVSTYDLSDGADREAFAALEDRRGNLSAGYADDLRSVAEAVSAATGREMTITDATATIERRGDVGVVRLSATWTNLAAVDGDELVLATPFDDGFAPDRPLVVRAPDGNEIVETSVDPAERSDGRATWTAGQDLSGFRTVVSTDGGDALAPSPAVPVLGLLAAGALLATRRQFCR